MVLRSILTESVSAGVKFSELGKVILGIKLSQSHSERSAAVKLKEIGSENKLL